MLPWISLSGTKLLLSVGLRRDVDDVEGSRSPLLVLHEPFFARYSYYSGHFPAAMQRFLVSSEIWHSHAPFLMRKAEASQSIAYP